MVECVSESDEDVCYHIMGVCRGLMRECRSPRGLRMNSSWIRVGFGVNHPLYLWTSVNMNMVLLRSHYTPSMYVYPCKIPDLWLPSRENTTHSLPCSSMKYANHLPQLHQDTSASSFPPTPVASRLAWIPTLLEQLFDALDKSGEPVRRVFLNPILPLVL